MDTVPLLTEMAALPRLLMPPDVKAVFRSETVPESVLMMAALMLPEVCAARLLRADADSEVSISVTLSSPSVLMPEEV